VAEHELELSADTMRRLVDEAMERIVDHIGSLPDQPLSYEDGGLELARSLEEPLPRDPTPFPSCWTPSSTAR